MTKKDQRIQEESSLLPGSSESGASLNSASDSSSNSVESEAQGLPPELRRRAEDYLANVHDISIDRLKTMPPEETHRVLHELRVHQIELEMQNEELRRSQTLLEAARSRYFDLYDLAPVGYCVVSEAGLIEEANLTLSVLLQVSPESLKKTPLYRYFLSEDQDIYYLQKKRLFNTSDPQSCELRMKRSTGETFWAHLAASITQTGDGQPACRIVVSDISVRKHSEERQEALLREVLNLKAALDEHAIVACTDTKGLITYVNDHFCKISKYSREEVIGRDHRVLNSGFHSKEFMTNLWQTILAGKVWRGEIRNRAKDGAFYWVATTIIPFLDGHGKVYQFVAIRFDISDKKRAKQVALQLARDASMAQISASLAHEINNPLAIMVGAAKNLPKFIGTPEKLASKIASIINAGERIEKIVRSLEKYSSAGEDTPAKDCDLATIINSAVALSSNKLKNSDTTLAITLGANAAVHGHEANLEQALVNLINNSIEAVSKHEKKWVKIETFSVDARSISLWISDSGAGVPEVVAEKMFDPFFTTKSEVSGAGLGLSIARGIIESHKGAIALVTNHSNTCFEIRLPALQISPQQS